MREPIQLRPLNSFEPAEVAAAARDKLITESGFKDSEPPEFHLRLKRATVTQLLGTLGPRLEILRLEDLHDVVYIMWDTFGIVSQGPKKISKDSERAIDNFMRNMVRVARRDRSIRI